MPNYQCKAEPPDEFRSSSITKLSHDQTQQINIRISQPKVQEEILRETISQPKKLNLAKIRKIGVPQIATSPVILTNLHQPQHNGQSAMQASA